MGVKSVLTAIAHPQVKSVERINCTLKPMIWAFISKDQTSWDEHLGEFQLAYNSSYHASLHMSPYYLVHGNEPQVSDKVARLEINDLDSDDTSWRSRINRLDQLRH